MDWGYESNAGRKGGRMTTRIILRIIGGGLIGLGAGPITTIGFWTAFAGLVVILAVTQLEGDFEVER